MVSITFKAVYLFLALFALPQVLSAPAIVALDVRHNPPTREQTVKEALKAHNTYRRGRDIAWNTDLEREAWNIVSSCSRTSPDGRRMNWRFESDTKKTSMEYPISAWANAGGTEQHLVMNGKQVGCSTNHCSDASNGEFHYFVCIYNM